MTPTENPREVNFFLPAVNSASSQSPMPWMKLTSATRPRICEPVARIMSSASNVCCHRIFTWS